MRKLLSGRRNQIDWSFFANRAARYINRLQAFSAGDRMENCLNSRTFDQVGTHRYRGGDLSPLPNGLLTEEVPRGPLTEIPIQITKYSITNSIGYEKAARKLRHLVDQ